ncbi:phosphate acyltransferase PlsX [Pontiella sulfatireligans]|uniref:Phosphate acyltransferase n=1 Tax=Pontiella sulfatireligans TaxID=2750658 RepID=A0A6C2UKT7_9BACT|nr:phosphate acyltransferase PlsX [Pontiella sulfatireligans]VGO20579.1 Phosphate acyltransferase [Pontiella sulfatireligans]
MRISIDAMGGDYAPQEIVAGTLQAAEKLKGLEKLFLVGDETAIKTELAKHKGAVPSCIEIVHASEVVGMGESPAVAIRRKKDSSITRALELVKDGKADAIFSAGNTGAAVAGATLKLRTLTGVARPAIAAIMPTPKDPFVLLDAGANPDSTPEMLQQFAVMGSIYSREILGVKNPNVGLLSIGEEAAKGNETTKKTFRLLDESHLNFSGNVESRDLFSGKVSVAVCDGFVGNVVLKTSEAVASMISSWLKIMFRANPVRILGYFLSRGVFKEMRSHADPSSHGGAPLLGANGIVIIGHGSSNAHATFNGIRVASEAIDHDLNHLIEAELASINPKT